MSFAIKFTVPGDPVSKARHRTGRYGGTYTPRKTVAYEQLVAWAAKKAMLDAGHRNGLNSDARFAVTMDFYLATERRIDLDNLAKSIMDGLTPHKPRGRARPPGLFWKDDSQVDVIAAQKGLAATMKCEPHAVITVRIIG